MAATVAILKFSNDITSQTISQIEPKRREALDRYRDSELLKWFRSNIQDGYHGGHLEILQTTSYPKIKLD